MPFTPWTLPAEHVARTRNGVTVHRIRTDEEIKAFRAFVVGECKRIGAAKQQALEAGNLDLYNAAMGEDLGLATLIYNIESTGNSQRPEQAGLWVAGWAVCQTKDLYPAETLPVKVNTVEVLALSQRVRTLGNLQEMYLEFGGALDETLAGHERELAPVVRVTNTKLEPTYETNWKMRRLARPIMDYATGSAKLAAEQAKKNRKLVADTKAGLLNQLKETAGAAGPASPTPPGPGTPGSGHITKG